ncbi:MAG: hypothetical protein ACRC33_28925 [Gemmataceae bacterium]
MASDESILDRLRKRPGMFLGECSLTALWHFINGYHFALTRHAIRDEGDPLTLPRDFHDWVAYRLRFTSSTSGWRDMILSRSGSEESALNRFFTLLDEHHARRPRLVAKLVGLRKSYTRTCGGVTEQLHYPPSISLVTYTDDPGFFALSDTEDELPTQGFFPCIGWFETFTGAERARLTVVDPEWNYGTQGES